MKETCFDLPHWDAVNNLYLFEFRYWLVACVDGSVGFSSVTLLGQLVDEVPTTPCTVA